MAEKQEKKVRVKGINWGHEETRALIAVVAKKNILRMTTSKGFKQVDLYKSLEPLMKEQGFAKTAIQMQIKMKHLKEAYYKCKRENWKAGAVRCPFAYFQEMDELLRFKRPLTAADSVSFLREQSGINSDLAVSGNGSGSSIDTDKLGIDAEHSKVDIEPGASVIEKNDVVPEESEVRLSIDSNDPPAKTSGRLSYKKRAQEFSEIFCSKQAAMFNEILEKQNKALEETIRKQLHQQRNWEMHILQQQYENQMEQNRTLLDEFFKRLEPTVFLPELIEEEDGDDDDNKIDIDCNIKIEQDDF